MVRMFGKAEAFLRKNLHLILLGVVVLCLLNWKYGLLDREGLNNTTGPQCHEVCRSGKDLKGYDGNQTQVCDMVCKKD